MKIIKNNKIICSIIIIMIFTNSLSFANNSNSLQSNSIIQEINKCKDINMYDYDALVDEMDTVKFGSYPQNDVTGASKEPIEWIVLKKTENEALLISKYALDYSCYHNEYIDITWENCFIRKWLNDVFYNFAFSNEEKLMIKDTELINDIFNGNNTVDKVFFLTINEIQEIVPQPYELNTFYRLATTATNFAKQIKKTYDVGSTDSNNKTNAIAEGGKYLHTAWADGNVSYMLRNNKYELNRHDYMSGKGYILTTGAAVINNCYIRPVISIRFN